MTQPQHSTAPLALVTGASTGIGFALAGEFLDHGYDVVVAADDAAILRAVRLVHEHVGLVVEPSGAAGLAALLADGGAAARWRGARVATPLCGGNVTPEQARAWLCA